MTRQKVDSETLERMRDAVMMLKSAHGHLFMAGGMSEANDLTLRALRLVEAEVGRVTCGPCHDGECAIHPRGATS